MYTVKEIYSTLQGEGAHTGRAAVFLRFAGCNLWSGLERDRAGAACRFCDTAFVGADGPGGGKFADAGAVAERGSPMLGGDRFKSPLTLSLSPLGRGDARNTLFARRRHRQPAPSPPRGDGQGEGAWAMCGPMLSAPAASRSCSWTRP